MVKKINEKTIAIQMLAKIGYRECEISSILKLKRTYVAKWLRTQYKETIKRKSKIDIVSPDGKLRSIIKGWADRKFTGIDGASAKSITSKLNHYCFFA